MAKDYAERFYNSRRWIGCRASYIAQRIRIDGGRCEHCNQDIGYIVHHKTPLTPSNINDPTVALNHDNLEYVCTKCHNIEHKSKYSWGAFDTNGQPLPRHRD